MASLTGELTPLGDLAQRELPLITMNSPEVLYRIQHTAYPNPLFFGAAGLNRWDCPVTADPLYNVLYTALEPKGAFYETLGHDIKKQIFSDLELKERRLWIIDVCQSLTFVDLTGDGLARLQVDSRLTSTRELSLPQAWSHAFHSHPSRPDGICYVSRHQPQLHCAALFERAKDKLRAGKSNSLHYWQHPLTGETAVDYIETRGGEIVIESLLR
jgi:hypothetical protein